MTPMTTAGTKPRISRIADILGFGKLDILSRWPNNAKLNVAASEITLANFSTSQSAGNNVLFTVQDPRPTM